MGWYVGSGDGAGALGLIEVGAIVVCGEANWMVWRGGKSGAAERELAECG